MGKRNRRFGVHTVLGILGLCVSLYFLIPRLQAQEVDPFYLKPLQEGERLYLAGDYLDAVKRLEIAEFGLMGTPENHGKACIYLSLCFYHLQELERSESFLKRAREVLGEEGLQTAGIAAAAKQELDNLLFIFHMKERRSGGIPGKAGVDPVVYRRYSKELNDRLEKEPENTALYYDLYSLHLANKNNKEAIKTLEDLVEKKPGEFRGFSFLGHIFYSERDYKKAEEYFGKVLEITGAMSGMQDVKIEAEVYSLLCLKNRRKDKDVLEKTEEILSQYNEEDLLSVSLESKDKSLLQEILDDYKIYARRKETEERVDELKRLIKMHPQDAEMYEQLYRLYLGQEEIDKAQDVLEDLIKHNPQDVEHRFWLGKLLYSREKYKDSFKEFDRLMRPPLEVNLSQDRYLRSLVYCSLCLYHQGERDRLSAYLTSLRRNFTSEKITEVIREEGLEEDWQNIQSIFSFEL